MNRLFELLRFGFAFDQQTTAFWSLLLQVTVASLGCWMIARLLVGKSAALAHLVCAAGLWGLLLLPLAVWANSKNFVSIASVEARPLAMTRESLSKVPADIPTGERVTTSDQSSDPRVDLIVPRDTTASEALSRDQGSVPAAPPSQLETIENEKTLARDAAELSASTSTPGHVGQPVNNVETLAIASEQRRTIPLTMGRMLYVAWFCGAVVLVARLARAAWLLRRTTRESRLAVGGMCGVADQVSAQMQFERKVQLRISNDRRMPVAYWWMRWMIVLPASAETWSDERLRQVLAHELGHVVRRDALTDFIGQCVCCLYWFHPTLWLLMVECRRLRELACDDLVLHRTQILRTTYATHLFEVVAECTGAVPPLASDGPWHNGHRHAKGRPARYSNQIAVVIRPRHAGDYSESEESKSSGRFINSSCVDS